MSTNLSIDQDLLETAKQLGGFKTKKDTVNKALEEFIRRQKINEVTDLFGTVPLHPFSFHGLDPMPGI